MGAQLCPALTASTLTVKEPAGLELGSPPGDGGGGVDVAGHDLLPGRDVHGGNAGVGVGRSGAPDVATVGQTGVGQETGGRVTSSQAAAVGPSLHDEAVHLVAVHLQHTHRPPHLGHSHPLALPSPTPLQQVLHHRPLRGPPVLAAGPLRLVVHQVVSEAEPVRVLPGQQRQSER